MKKRIYIFLVLFAGAAMVFTGCKKSELETLYPNPANSSTATVENFLTGLLKSANEVVLPWYWRFFVVEQPTQGHYTQVMGWYNSKAQYIPPAQAMDWRWDQYYNGPMTQFRVMEDLYNNLSESDQSDYRIFYLAAKIFFYDQTEQIVDLFGDIPWSDAGRVRELGDLNAALPKYDDAKTIYTTMMADLKSIGDELASIDVPAFYAGLFQSKDYLNDGDISLWQKYANSLRLRMLMRVSGTMDVAADIAEILNNPGQYPVVESNDEAILLDAGGPDLYATTKSQNGGIKQAMETWGEYDIAPYALVKHMVDNSDPRLVITFDPNVNGEYIGMNPMNDGTVQAQNLNDGLISRYDTASFTQNDYFPGFVITAAEVSFMKAEAFFKGYASGDAKVAYETGVEQSINFYYDINSTGDYREPLPRPTADEIAAYLAQPGVSWDANDNKMKLIGEQKWINTGLGQMPQTWAEYRRLGYPELEFLPDNSSEQTMPPSRWLYPQSEHELNGANYSQVAGKDDLNTKIFWDVN